MNNNKFHSAVQELLARYDGTSLFNRWKQAISFGAGLTADAWWIRDSDDLVNIVWLNSDGIRDITLLVRQDADGDGPEEDLDVDNDELEEDADASPDEELTEVGSDAINFESMFNFIPLRNIVTFEEREAPEVAYQYGLGVSGNRIVQVVVNANQGNLYWVANTQEENETLNAFFTDVLTAYSHVM